MVKQKNINFLDELEDTFQKLNLEKEDVCLTGSSVLKILGLRENKDIDCIIRSSIRENISSEQSAFKLSNNIEVVGKNWGKPIGISENEIIDNSKNHFLFNGFKVIKPEILFSVKQSFLRDKDFDDISLLEQYALSSPDWDWSLVTFPSISANISNSQIKQKLGYFVDEIKTLKKIVKLILFYSKAVARKLIYPHKTYHNLLSIINQETQKYQFKTDIVHLIKESDLQIKYSATKILAKQYRSNKFNRMDLIVRYLAIEEYFEGNDYGFYLYNKMQKNRVVNGVSKYGNVPSEKNFRKLISNVTNNGFNPNSKIELDSQLCLNDGAHRLALSAYMGIKDVPIKIVSEKKNVVYGTEWFKNKNFTKSEIDLIENKKSEIFQKLGLLFPIIIWPPIQAYFDEIENNIRSKFCVYEAQTIQLDRQLSNFVRQLYAIDDIDLWKVEKKISGMSSYSGKIRFLLVEIPEPKFRKKTSSNNDISTIIEKLKANYRQKYSVKVDNYFHDIIIHACDNYLQNIEAIKTLNAFKKQI